MAGTMPHAIFIETDVEEGVPVAEALPGEGRIASGELPGGPVISTVYTGVPEGLSAAYARIGAWLQEHGEEPAGPAREQPSRRKFRSRAGGRS